MEKDDKIYIAGHTGLVGSALRRILAAKGYKNVVSPERGQLDLLDQAKVAKFFELEKPSYVFFAAGKTGGIYANNTYRADFLYENIVMQCNVIHQSFLHEVEKLLFFACSCIYPCNCPQPMKEEYILSGSFEPTNEPFAVAKIAGLKMCESYNRQYGTDFITVIPTNLYGPNQRYEPMNSLVVPSLIQKFHQAKVNDEDGVVIWGSGRPARDCLYVDDLVDASVFLMEFYEGNDIFNIGSGRDYTIADIAAITKKITGYSGDIVYDRSLPDGVMQKLQDVTKINDLGWKYRIDLEEGIELAYQDYLLCIENIG
ncbi:MAG: GDP-L-fucose synthase [Desulfobacterales bacterium]|jgi:GDP-L-fucose synthase